MKNIFARKSTANREFEGAWTSSEIFGAAEYEIISFENCEISPFGQCEMKFATSHLRSKYFTA